MSSSKHPGDWKRKSEGVQWSDVWEWLAEISDTYGLWGHIALHPPMPGRRGKDHGQVVLTLTRYLVGEGTEVIRHYRELPSPLRAKAEDIALQLVAQVSSQLDREAYEAERAAGQGVLPF